MNLDVQTLLNVVILAATAVTAVAALPAVVAPLARLIRGKASAQDINTLTELANRVVTSVEQTMATSSNEEKLGVAIDKVSTAVSMMGIKASQEQIRDAIEMAVFLLPSGQTVPQVPSDSASVVGG